MKRTWVEIICDGCGCADHFSPGEVDQQARDVGWIVTRKGEHYCDRQCKKRRLVRPETVKGLSHGI